MATTAKGKGKEKPLASLLAGATAGGVESFITFPLENLKTQLQFASLGPGKVCRFRHLSLYFDRIHTTEMQ